MLRTFALSCMAAVAAVSALASASPAVAGEPDPLHQRTGFDNGLSAGWLYQRQVPGVMWVDKFLGQDAPAIHHVQGFATGSMMFQRRASWLQPLKSGQPVRIQLDTKARLVNYLGAPTRRELVVELRDYDNPPVDHPYASVWTIVGYLDAKALPGWRTWSVTIADPASLTLPEGWGGYGAEDKKGRPYLPPDRTFADVLAGVDEIAITTYQPGYLYGSDHDFDVLYDNIEIGVVAP
ncbi:PEP-CTERM sorting domain-containing protein [Ideonella sp. DXS29W]|uniref:PEP-CTERM sorting domain-containing protein n=1 Tax=Ideonella lacteola TaxID=2984193 RepID=A0ABU9BNN0_9BURK